MKVFVLYDKSGIHSGRELGSNIIGNFSREGVSVQKGRPARLEMLLNSGESFDYIINVGWYKEFRTGGAVVINTPSSISLSSNKRKARMVFAENEVPAPTLWLNPDDIPQDAFPVVARTTHHTKGQGFWLCNNAVEAHNSTRSYRKKVKKRILTKKKNRVWRDRYVDVNGATHFMKFIPNTREFRVHIVSNEIDNSQIELDNLFSIKTSEKVASAENADTTIKNHENGWVFSYPKDRKDPALPVVREAAKQAMLSVGLHWGAVDIMYSEDTGEAYVLEVNSSPCMTDESSNTVDKYVRGIGSMIGVYEKLEKKEKQVEEPEEEIVEEVEEPVYSPNRERVRGLVRNAIRRVV